MKLKIALFESVAEIIEEGSPEDWKHPLLTTAKFVFADDKGNSNNQGVEASEFDEIIRSAIGTPIKMKFVGVAAGHEGSIPIGHIRSMVKNTTEDGTNQLVGTAVLYAEEFPYEVQYLKDAFAEGKAPGISFELLYGDSILKDGIQWLKKIITKAATFVRNPAYGLRTSLMALASDRTVTDEDFNSAFLQIASELKEKEDQGGNKMTEQEIKELQDQLKVANEKVAELTTTLATRDSELADQTTKLVEAEAAKVALQATIDENIKNITKAERTAKMVAAGYVLDADAEKAAAKQTIWLELSDDAFASYLEDYIEAKKAAPKVEAQAAAKPFTLIPRPVETAEGKQLSYAEVKGSFGQLSRPERASVAQ